MRISSPVLVAFSTLAILVAGAAPASCSGVHADAGADAYMQIPGAQFVRGSMPAGSKNGPAVEQILLVNGNIWPGRENFPIGGNLAPSATGAAIGLRGDVGYWVVAAGVPNYLTPTYPSISAAAEFSLGIVPGTYTLVVQGVDQSGAYGLPSTQILYEEPSPLNPPATGALVVTLTWDTESNLSLHVVVPGGDEIYWGDQSTEPPLALDQVDGGSYGYIDYDSNANCVIDGLRREDAIWPDPPPPGQYTVRVDTPSLCGEPEANWTVKVVLKGAQVGEASGVALSADTWGSHGIGSGVLALQFTVP
jgi:hypothetical protein